MATVPHLVFASYGDWGGGNDGDCNNNTGDMLFFMTCYLLIQNSDEGTSLVVHWLRHCLPVLGMQVRSLVREARSHMPRGQKNQI